MAYLNVPQETVRKAGFFLDSVQQNDVARLTAISVRPS